MIIDWTGVWFYSTLIITNILIWELGIRKLFIRNSKQRRGRK